MKIRQGFVSNSSSSSFICSSTLSVKEAEEKLKAMVTFYNELYGTAHQFEDVFQKPFKITKDKKSKEYLGYIADWIFGENPQYVRCVKEKKDMNGKLIINGSEDNSVPYELFELIENFFSGTRVHLG